MKNNGHFRLRRLDSLEPPLVIPNINNSSNFAENLVYTLPDGWHYQAPLHPGATNITVDLDNNSREAEFPKGMS